MKIMEALDNAYGLIVDKPFSSAYAFVLWVFFCSITFFALGAVYILISIIFSFFGDVPSYAYYAVLGVFAFFLAFFSTGFKGAYFRMLYGMMEKKDPHMVDFVYFGFKFPHRFFIIYGIEVLVMLLGFSPLFGVYLLDPTIFETTLFMVLGAAYALFVMFVVHYLFILAPLDVAVFETHTFMAIASSLRYGIRKATTFLPLFCVYSFVFILTLVPILNILVWFYLYPVVMMAMTINLIEAGYGRAVKNL